MRKVLFCLSLVCLVAGSAVALTQYVMPDGLKSNKEVKVNNPFPAVKSTNGMARIAEETKSMAKASVQSDVLPFAYYDYELPDGEANFYAFQLYSVSSLYFRAMVHSTSNNVSERDYLCEYPCGPSGWDSGEYTLSAATMVGDKCWGYVNRSWAMGASQEPVGIFEIDLRSGEMGKCLINLDGVYSFNCDFLEMSYDPTTGYVYGLIKQGSGTMGLESTGKLTVARIDPDVCVIEEIGEIDYSYTMACDNGFMYIVQRDDIYTASSPVSLFKINLDEYASFTQDDLEKVATINHGFLQLDYYQTMEFDHTTHTLWWAGQKNGSSSESTGFFTTLNVKNGETGDELQELPYYCQYVGLAIPYEIAKDKAPSYVKNLKMVVAEEGECKVSFSWTNPTKDYQLGALESLTGVKVYRDGELYKTLESTGIGAAQTWEDTEVLSGNHTYKFVPYNTVGEGLSKTRVSFVGRDVPGTVTNLNVVTDGNVATISWTPSERGANTGWYDKSTLKYDVVRMPDRVTVATGITATTVTSEADVFKGYSFEITASNVDGVGATATTGNYPYGNPVDVPYKNELLSQSDANLITIADGNHDGYTWYYGRTAADISRNVYFYGMCAGESDDYLILPPFKFEEGKKYEIRFTYNSSNYYGTKEKFEVRQGNKNTAEAQTEVLGTMYGLPDYYTAYQEGQAYINDPSKGNYISIHICSEPNQGWAAVRDVVVREYSKTDLSVQKLEGSQIANVNTPNKYTLTVRNEGYASVANGMAQLVTYPGGKVLAEAPVGVLAAGETKKVTVDWTPTEKGNMNISAHVDLEGDTYPEDNDWDSYIPVEIREGEATNWVTVLESNGTGWRPIMTISGYAQLETIYFPDEVGVEKVNFNGLAYSYTPAADFTGLTSIPVEVYMATTTDEYAEPATFPEDIYTKVYEGYLDLTGYKAVNEVTMIFDTPFYYDGTENLLIKVVSPIKEATPDNVNWLIFDEQGKWNTPGASTWEDYGFRSVYFNNKKAMINDQVPALKLGYVNESGIKGITTVNLAKVNVNGRTLSFDGVQGTIEVIDASGRVVAKANNASQIKVNANGVYIVRSKNGANVASTKVVVK